MDTGEELDIEWSLRPIVIWLNAIGICLNECFSPRRSCLSVCRMCYSLLCFLLDVSISTVSFALTSSTFLTNEQSPAYKSNFQIDYIVSMIQSSVPHFLLLCYCRSSWKVTRYLIENVEFEFKFQRCYLLRMRKIASLAVLNIVFTVK